MSNNYPPMNVLTNQALKAIDDQFHAKSTMTGLPTGLSGIDETISGLQAGDLIVIGGRPSLGKTSLAMTIAQNAAIESKVSIGIFTMETSTIQLTKRMLSSIARIENVKIATGRLEQEDWRKLNHASHALSEADIYIEDGSLLTLDDLCQRAKKMDQLAHEKQSPLSLNQEHPNPNTEKNGVRLIVIDHLQLMSLNREASLKENELEEIGRTLKNLAKELGASVILLSQLDYKLEKRGDKSPKLKDFGKYSAIIEYADLVITIYRDEVYNPYSHEKGNALISIVKHRNGPLFAVNLKFEGEFGRFDNYTANQKHEPLY